MQRSVELSGVAGGRRFGGGAGRVRADRHSELSRRLPGRAAKLGGAGARQSERFAADQILCRRARTLSLRRDQIRQAARRRAGRQLRARRLHHCAACIEHARRTVGAGGSGQAAALFVPGGRFRPRAARKMGADHPRTVGRRSDHGDVRYGHRFRRDRQLLGLRRHHEGLARTIDPLALRPVRSRAHPARRAARLELPRRGVLHQPHFLRCAGPAAGRSAQCRRDAVQAAAGSGQSADFRRPRCACRQSHLHRVYEIAAARTARAVPAAAAHAAAAVSDAGIYGPGSSIRTRRGRIKFIPPPPWNGRAAC